MSDGTQFFGDKCDVLDLVQNQNYQISFIQYAFEYLNPTGIINAHLNLHLAKSVPKTVYRLDYEITFMRVSYIFGYIGHD